VASRPFEAWGLDVMGPLTLYSFVEYMDMLPTTYYTSKWVEVIALKEFKKENVVEFI